MKYDRRPVPRKRGFTLIETVLGLLLFSLVMTLVATLFTAALRININTNDTRRAVDDVITLSEEAQGGNTAAVLTLRATGGVTVEEELELVAFKAPAGDGEVSLYRFVYAKAEGGDAP